MPYHGIHHWQLSETTWVHVALQDHAASVSNCPLGGPVAPVSLTLNEYEYQKFVTAGSPKDCKAMVCCMVVVSGTHSNV